MKTYSRSAPEFSLPSLHGGMKWRTKSVISFAAVKTMISEFFGQKVTNAQKGVAERRQFSSNVRHTKSPEQPRLE